MSTDETLYWHFRAEQGEGSAMDWAIGPGEASAVRIRCGPTGQTMRRIEIPREMIRGTTGEEIHRRARQQLRASNHPGRRNQARIVPPRIELLPTYSLSAHRVRGSLSDGDTLRLG